MLPWLSLGVEIVASEPTATHRRFPAVLLLEKATEGLVVPLANPLLLCTTLGAATVNATPLLAFPPTLTTTLPVVAPVGTGTTMLVLPQLVGLPVVPLNETVLLPCVLPKLLPLMVTVVPGGPDVGERLLMKGPEPLPDALKVVISWLNTFDELPPQVAVCIPVRPTFSLSDKAASPALVFLESWICE